MKQSKEFKLFKEFIKTYGEDLELSESSFFNYEDEDENGNFIKYLDNSPYKGIDSDYYNNKLSKLNLEIGEYLKYEDILKGATLCDYYGGSGLGEEYWTVFYFPKLDIYIKFDGYYQSYEGSTFQQSYEVKPEEKTITVYNEII